MFLGLRLRLVPASLLLVLAALGLSTPAAAALPRLSLPENFSAVLDFRVVAADGEESWTDGGFGKSRFGAGDDSLDVEPVAAEAVLAWQPPISWNLTGTIAIAAQHEQDKPVDLVEAFLSWRPAPRGATRISARAGLFWPPVSLEHDGPTWTVSDMITPSAINSWIGEEVKVAGLEATVAHAFGGGEAAATFAVFGLNDTAGTLLAFRGWALHDLKSSLFSEQSLPLLNPFMQESQAPATQPSIEIDDRPGFYGRLSWRMAAPVTLEALYYDNRGDPEALTDTLQWGWETRFLNVGARLELGEHTRLSAQALTGTTEMGVEVDERYWVETRFRAAYLRLTHEIGPVALSGRIDLFDTRETGTEMGPQESEEGWAVAGAARYRLSEQAQLLVEGLHVDSERGVRTRLGLTPHQDQTVVQGALRLSL